MRIFLRVIAQALQANSPGAAHVDKVALHIGAVAFIHRFGASLNEHVHFHVCAVDGVFEEVAGEAGKEGDGADAASQTSPPHIIFHPATCVTADAVGQAQASLRKRSGCAKRAVSWSTAAPNSTASPAASGQTNATPSEGQSTGHAPTSCTSRHSNSSCALPRWCRHRARTATGHTACWRPIHRCGLRRWHWPQAKLQARIRHSPSQAVCPQRGMPWVWPPFKRQSRHDTHSGSGCRHGRHLHRAASAAARL